MSKKLAWFGRQLKPSQVLNHKAGADDKEVFQVVDVDQEGITKAAIYSEAVT